MTENNGEILFHDRDIKSIKETIGIILAVNIPLILIYLGFFHNRTIPLSLFFIFGLLVIFLVNVIIIFGLIYQLITFHTISIDRNTNHLVYSKTGQPRIHIPIDDIVKVRIKFIPSPDGPVWFLFVVTKDDEIELERRKHLSFKFAKILNQQLKINVEVDDKKRRIVG